MGCVVRTVARLEPGLPGPAKQLAGCHSGFPEPEHLRPPCRPGAHGQHRPDDQRAAGRDRHGQSEDGSHAHLSRLPDVCAVPGCDVRAGHSGCRHLHERRHPFAASGCDRREGRVRQTVAGAHESRSREACRDRGGAGRHPGQIGDRRDVDGAQGGQRQQLRRAQCRRTETRLSEGSRRQAGSHAGAEVGNGRRARAVTKAHVRRHHTLRFTTIKPVSKRQGLLLAALLFPSFSFAQAQTVNATIDASKTGAPISKYIYGQFLEHIGSIVNSGIWAEMLDDRKFYNAVTSKPPAVPEGPAWMRMAPRRWMPVGPGEFVTMDRNRAYTGDHSPAVQLSPTETRGIQQSGLAVRKGKAYTGRVVAAGAAGTVVKVNLVWGKTDGDKQTDAVTIAGAGYKKYPLRSDSTRLNSSHLGISYA